MSEEDTSSASGNACSASPSHQQLTEEWRSLSGGGGSSAGSRTGGPRSLLLKRSENGFGFTLRHFIVYPPESYTVLVPGCRSGCQPMDTMFVKSVRPNSPAARAGLQTGDRVVSVNGQTVTGSLTYAHVVHMISQSPKHLHLLVVPRQDDLLQLYFGDTAHNPETNPRVRLRPSVGGVGAAIEAGGVGSPPSAQLKRRPPLLGSTTTHHQSVPPLTPPSPLHRNRAATNAQGGRLSSSECSSLSLEVASSVGGGGEWRRASDGGGGGGEDSCSASSSLDSMSRADFHSSDDSLIIDRIRKSFEQKEEFLRRGVVAAVSPPTPRVAGGAVVPPQGAAPPIQWPAAIPASAVIKATNANQQVVPWRTPPTASSGTCLPLTRIDEATGGGLRQTHVQATQTRVQATKPLTRIDEATSGAGGGGLVPVAARAQVFEEGGQGDRSVQLFRSELAGLSEKRSAPDVALRRRQFETTGGGGGGGGGGKKSQDGGQEERRATGGGGGRGGGLSRSLDMPCAMSGNRTTPVGGPRLHCDPPTSTQGLVTSTSSSSIGAAGSATSWMEGDGWVTSTSQPSPTTQQRHKAVRQDSYLAACHKPQTQTQANESAEAVSAAELAAATADCVVEVAKQKSPSTSADLDDGKQLKKKKKKLKSSSLRSAVRPSRLDLGKVARPLSCSTPTTPQPDAKDDSLKQSPTEDHQHNSDVDQSHQKRVSYLKQIWTENANRTSPTPSNSSHLSERLKKKREVDDGPIVVVEGSLLCCTVSSRVAAPLQVPSSGEKWKPVWAVLRGPVLHLMRLKQAETPGPGVEHVTDREQWWREDLLARGALIEQQQLTNNATAAESKRGGGRHVISVQLALEPQQATSVHGALDQLTDGQDNQLGASSCDQLVLLQASDAISHQQWLRALLNVVEKRKTSEDQPTQPQQAQPQVPVVQQQQLPSPKQKTWKGRVAKQFRRIGQSGSSPISPTAPATNVTATTYQEGASIGVPLDWCPQSQTHECVPLLVEVCCGEVEARGLEVVGVYRVPGNTAAVTALTEQVNRAGTGDTIGHLVSQADVNVVSSLLKSLFRRLPDALLTSDLYPLFIAADKIQDPLLRAATIRKLVHSLPDHHFETLRFVMAHLQRVVARCAVNKMEARNLAIVFGPTLVRTADDNSMLTLVTDMSHQCRIVETLILHADWCFSDEDIDRLQLTSGGGNEATPPLPPPSVEHITDNHSLLLENIHKVQGMKTDPTSSSSSSGPNLVTAKDIVVSIIGAANRKMHKSKSRSGCSSKQQSVSSLQSREEDCKGVAASIRESVLFSGSILAASSHRHGKKGRDSVDGGGSLERSGGDELQDNKDEAISSGQSSAAVDADGMIRTYTGLSACKQERIRRFEQETKAMLQRENAARLGGVVGGVGVAAMEERGKRELDSSDYTDASTAESPPSGEDLLSSLTSTFDAKLRSLLSSSSSSSSPATLPSDVITPQQAAAPVTSEEDEEVGGGTEVGVGEPVFRDPSLHRSTSQTTSSSVTGIGHQLNRANSSSATVDCLKQQTSVNEEAEEKSVLVQEKKKKREEDGADEEEEDKKKKREEEGEEEGEEKKDDSKATKDPLSCKQDAAAAAFVCKVRRSESLEKRALKNADDLLMGDSKMARRSSDRALKRSDSLTKSEKTESNLYRRRQQASQQASKRKNGVGSGDGACALSSGVGSKCAIKRRHTVGGTKDFGGGSDVTYTRRTSSPDLSRAAVHLGGMATVPKPLESHV